MVGVAGWPRASPIVPGDSAMSAAARPRGRARAIDAAFRCVLKHRAHASPGAGGRPSRSSTAASASREHALGRLGGVDRANPLGLGARQLVVGGGDPREEALALALQPVGLERALVLARAPGGGGDAQQQRAVGREAAGGEQVDRAHLLHAQPRPAPW